MAQDSFGARGTLSVGGRDYTIYRLSALADRFDIARLPYSLKVLLENLLRHEDGVNVRPEDIEGLADFAKSGAGEREIAFSPARILLQDLTGVPAVVDLAAVRDAVEALGGDAESVNPQIPVDLVIDHSVVAEVSARPDAFQVNAEFEFDRNVDRYRFLRWGQQAFSNFRLIPPDNGICHQVNLELLSQVVFSDEAGNAYPDSLVGTDSHTPMANGLSILAWGVGGIEAEAALLGQPISMLVPPVVGLRLEGELPEGATATDLVLTLAELLRKHGVVEKFVECYGPGVANVPVENRATIGNMSPEYGSTVTIFPIDEQTLRYLRTSGRPSELVELVEAYAKEQGMWHDPSVEPVYSETLSLDLSSVRPSISGPSLPQQRVPLNRSKQLFSEALDAALPDAEKGADGRTHHEVAVRKASGESFPLDHGSVVIAAITSCTNTSNPQVMLAAGLLAKAAVERGVTVKPWVKTSLAPGSRVVMDYYERAGLVPYLEKLGFGLVGFGCTTCIGNSGPLAPEISEAIRANGLSAVAVLSGNRNFEGRIHPDVRMSYLASPPLVVAYALAGTMDIDLYNEPLGEDASGAPVYLRDLWPSTEEVLATAREAVQTSGFTNSYAHALDGDERWRSIEVPAGQHYAWDDVSTYVRKPPYFDGMTATPPGADDIAGARVLALFGDAVTTDHISPANEVRLDSPAGRWLSEQGVEPSDFNTYGARRGNHEVMMRGTFANNRIRNGVTPGIEGGVSLHLPDEEVGSMYDVAMRYVAEGVPLVVLAGKLYGSGSSRDWAAKGPLLLGVRAAIAESFERIHRSNLIGMGIAPLVYLPGENAASLGLTGRELFSITGIAGVEGGELIGRRVQVRADDKAFEAILRIDTPTEADYFLNGGILHYVVRKLAAAR
ncbi:MAG TPA: aconitate hydratase AcnA [Acidimicrobiales bacterium]|nr:aconitate hydratase AcnA [Acidimicrobiales bacterium]